MPRPASCLYRLGWDESRLAWTVAYDGQEWASICAYLPGRPQMTEPMAREWVDRTVGPLRWLDDRTAEPAA